MHLDREAAVRGREEDAPPDAKRLRDEESLPRAVAHVLDHRVREDDVELSVGEGKRAGVSLDVADVWIASAERRAVLEPERRDLLWPRVQLLEEVERPAAVALPEPELVGPDVEDAGARSRLKLLEEEPELAPAGAQRDRVDKAHGRSMRVWPPRGQAVV